MVNDAPLKQQLLSNMLGRRGFHEIGVLPVGNPFKHLERKVLAFLQTPVLSNETQFNVRLNVAFRASGPNGARKNEKKQKKKRKRANVEQQAEEEREEMRRGIETRLRIVCDMLNEDCRRLTPSTSSNSRPLPSQHSSDRLRVIEVQVRKF
jgi:hypothetical protein